MVAIITGASSGFGKAIAELLSQKGYTVYGTSRYPEKNNNAQLYKLDLEDENSIAAFADTVLSKEKQIDVLINNAGIIVAGPMEYSSSALIRKQFEANFFGLVSLTQKILPLMRKNKSGMIINISSVGGLMGLPFHAFYSASKFAVEGYTEALRLELKPFNIKVYNINPGDFKTNLTQNRIYALDRTDIANPYHENYKRTAELCAKMEQAGPDPSLVAKLAWKLISKKPNGVRHIEGKFDQKLSFMMKGMLPSSVFENIMKSYYKIK
jgi:short-subunit dehydrogenase